MSTREFTKPQRGESCPNEQQIARVTNEPELKDVFDKWNKLSPEEKAYRVIKIFLDRTNVEGSEEMHDNINARELTLHFLEWFDHPINREAKDRAMLRVFDEGPPEEEPEDHTAWIGQQV